MKVLAIVGLVALLAGCAADRREDRREDRRDDRRSELQSTYQTAQVLPSVIADSRV